MYSSILFVLRYSIGKNFREEKTWPRGFVTYLCLAELPVISRGLDRRYESPAIQCAVILLVILISSPEFVISIPVSTLYQTAAVCIFHEEVQRDVGREKDRTLAALHLGELNFALEPRAFFYVSVRPLALRFRPPCTQVFAVGVGSVARTALAHQAGSL